MTEKAKPEVTDEMLTQMLPVNSDWEKENKRHERQNARYTALNHAVQMAQLRKGLIEEPGQVRDRVIADAVTFYAYLIKDDSE